MNSSAGSAAGTVNPSSGPDAAALPGTAILAAITATRARIALNRLIIMTVLLLRLRRHRGLIVYARPVRKCRRGRPTIIIHLIRQHHTVFEYHRSRAILRDVRLMRHQDDRCASLIQSLQDRHDLHT